MTREIRRFAPHRAPGPVWESRTAIPTKPEHVTPELRKLREAWYASNPWRPDWQMNHEKNRGAYNLFRERRTA